MKVPADAGRLSIGLAAADADGVIAAGNDRLPGLGHHAQVAILQVEVNLLACSGFEVDSLKFPQKRPEAHLEQAET